MKMLNGKCKEEDAYKFFDFLLSQKIKIYQQLYPHFVFQFDQDKNSGSSPIDLMMNLQSLPSGDNSQG